MSAPGPRSTWLELSGGCLLRRGLGVCPPPVSPPSSPQFPAHSVPSPVYPLEAFNLETSSFLFCLERGNMFVKWINTYTLTFLRFLRKFYFYFIYFLLYATFKHCLAQILDSLYYFSVRVNQTYVRVGWLLLKMKQIKIRKIHEIYSGEIDMIGKNFVCIIYVHWMERMKDSIKTWKSPLGSIHQEYETWFLPSGALFKWGDTNNIVKS